MSIVFMKVSVTSTVILICVDKVLSSSLDRLFNADSSWQISRGRRKSRK